MSAHVLLVKRIERRVKSGATEHLDFESGVNLLVGRANTGKTVWLRTLDYLLGGDADDNPYQNGSENKHGYEYTSARVLLQVNDGIITVERRWREPGVRSKIFVDNNKVDPDEFQRMLLEKIGLPLLHYPKGNPMSRQTWPELSFRTLFRHMYRRQRFWSDIADKQPESEQHACVLLFLGVADLVFTQDYGRLIALRLDAARLRARCEERGEAIDRVARDLVSMPGHGMDVTLSSVQGATERLMHEIASLREQREQALSTGVNHVVSRSGQVHIKELIDERARLVHDREELQIQAGEVERRWSEVQDYIGILRDERGRMDRAQDAARVFADLKVTHCPACDQSIEPNEREDGKCVLCHRPMTHLTLPDQSGDLRLEFERGRLKGDLEEAQELALVLAGEKERHRQRLIAIDDRLRIVDSALEGTRRGISALAQVEVSALDMKVGELLERQRQLRRVEEALATGDMMERIAKIEAEIEPLERRVRETERNTDFESAATALEQGMNEYLSGINARRPGVWTHSEVNVRISRSRLRIRVGNRPWDTALGGTDTLYFLMAYHYGLMALRMDDNANYPGVAIIDVPGEFAGEAIAEKENFIVEPFIELLAREELAGSQLIITGVAFEALEHAHRLPQTFVYNA